MRVTRRVEEMRAEGIEVLGFGAGEPDFPSPPIAVEAACRALADGHTKYTPAVGLLDLRRAMLERYADRWATPWNSVNEVAITVGAKAALFETVLALIDRGDEVLIQSPCWVTFPEQVRLAGGDPVVVEGDSLAGFPLLADPLIERMGPRTRAVVVNSPCNPSGRVMARSELQRLVEACTERGVVLISDETYDHFIYDSVEYTSAAAFAGDHPETVVVIGSFSKTWAMTGWRIGFALGPKPILGALGVIQSHATSNPTSFAMWGALAALREPPEDHQKRLEVLGRRRDRVVELLQAMPGVECPMPEGAFYVFPRIADCLRSGEGSVDLAEALLEKAHVAVVAGAAFGEDQHMRISLTRPLIELEDGLARIELALTQRSAVGSHSTGSLEQAS